MIKNHHLRNFPAGAFILAFSLLIGSCSKIDRENHDHEGEVSQAEAHGDHEEIVRLTEAELAEFAIVVDTARAGVIQQRLDLTGEIVVDPDRLAHIIPRFPGIVKKVRKRIGDRVRAGEVLAVIESNESLAPYEITSLISGTVIKMHLTRGEVVTDAGHDIVVADLSRVWADLSAHQKDLEHLRVGQMVTVTAGGNIPPFTGQITWISPTLNEARRTATVRVIVTNPDGHWRPGLFINGAVITASTEVPVAIPGTALETIGVQTVVFVKTEKGFEPRAVKTGKENNTTVGISEGLASGDLYVSKGGFTLKAELEKGAFGDGHAH